jgi:hypothetical protein
MEIMQPEELRQERMKKSKQILREMWGTSKHNTMHDGSTRRKGETESERENKLKEIMAEYISNFMRNIHLHNQKAHQTPTRINAKIFTSHM